MKRRRFINGAAVCGFLAPLSGCATVREATSFGPAEFDNIEIDTPDEVLFSERFDIVIRAENTGGERGDFSTTLTIGEDPFTSQENVQIEDIRVGETGSTVREDVFISHIGEIPYRITDYGVEESVSVTTKPIDFGETFESPYGYDLKVKDVSVHPTLRTDTPEDEIYTADANSMLYLIVDIEVDGPLSEADIESLEVEDGQPADLGYDFDIEKFDEVDNAFDSDAERNESGKMIFEGPVRDGEVQTDIVRSTFEEDQPPELRWNTTGIAAPEFDVNINVPSAVTVGESVVSTVNVRNVGKAGGRYRSRLTAADSGFSDPEVFETKVVDIEPGDEETLEFSYDASGEDTPGRRLEPLGESISPDIEPIELAFGEAFTTSEGTKFMVDTPMNRPGYAGEVAYEGVWQEETVNASDDETIAILDVDVRDGHSGDLGYDRFSLLFDGHQIEPIRPRYSAVEYTSPVSGKEYSRHNDEPGGLLLFAVPEEAETESITIRVEFYEEHGAHPVHWVE